MVFQANTGFQYCLTFPKHFALNSKLPAQIRWSLAYDEALARDLAKHLNLRFQGLLQKSNEDRVQFGGDFILRDLGEFHEEIKGTLARTQMVWAIRPSPAKLASSDPTPGPERLLNECQEHPRALH